MRWIGRQIGPGQRFRVLRKLGERALLVTYQGRDSRTDDDVAIKVLDESLARDRALIARLEAEVELQSTPLHAALLRFEGHFRRGDSLALHRPWVDGANLADVLAARGSPLTASEARRLLRALLEPLVALHEAGLCHLGLTPQNVLLRASPNGSGVVLADLGVARVLGPHLAASRRLDSPFSAPEMVRGAAAVDQRADVFSVGVLVRAMLTGSLDPAALAGHARSMPEPMASLARRAAAPEPEDRFPDARALRAALNSLDDSLETAEHYAAPSEEGLAAESASADSADEAVADSFPPRAAAELERHETPPGGTAADIDGWDEAFAQWELEQPPATVLIAAQSSAAPLAGAPVEPQASGPEPSSGAQAEAASDALPAASIVRVQAPRGGVPHRRPYAPRVALRPRDDQESWGKIPTARINRPGVSGQHATLDETPPATYRVETPRVPPKAVPPASSAPAPDGEDPKTLTAELEAAAELGAAGALNDEPEPGSVRPPGASGARLAAPSGGLRVAESRQIRAVPAAYMTAPPTASLPAVGTPVHPGSPRWAVVSVTLLAAAALALLLVRPWETAPPPSATAAEPSAPAATGPAETAFAAPVGSTSAMPAAAAPVAVANGSAPTRGPAQTVAPAPSPAASRAELVGSPEAAWPTRPAPDADRQSVLHFASSLWAEGNTWVLHREIDSPDPLLRGDYYLRRRIVDSRPHPWGVRVTLAETGGVEPERTRDLIASAACLIDPATERIELCLPAQSDELVQREVAGQDTPVFRTLHDRREVLFAPALGWVEEDELDTDGTRVTTRLVGWRIGDEERGEISRPAPTCTWAQTVRSGPGIGRTDGPGGLTAELALAQSWGLEGRLRRLDLPLSSRYGAASLSVFYSRYKSAYALTGAGAPALVPEASPLAVLDLPLAHAWVYEADLADVAVLLFEKDGVSTVQALTLDDDESDILAVTEPEDATASEVSVDLAAGPAGCTLRVVRRLEDGGVRLTSLDLGPTGPVPSGDF